MQTYYMICNNNNRVIAIHRIYDSSYASFRKLITACEYPFLTLNYVVANQFGMIVSESILHTYSHSSSIIVNNATSTLTPIYATDEKDSSDAKGTSDCQPSKS